MNNALMERLGIVQADLEPDESKSQSAMAGSIEDIGDAVADLSEMVSDNTVTSADLSDAIADLSAIVSELMGE